MEWNVNSVNRCEVWMLSKSCYTEKLGWKISCGYRWSSLPNQSNRIALIACLKYVPRVPYIGCELTSEVVVVN